MSNQRDYNSNELRSEVIRLLTKEQISLLRYIATLVGDIHDARNVLQQTNVVLWQKFEKYRPGTNFQAWARTVAYYQSLAYVRDQRRDRLVFDEDLIQRLATQPIGDDEDERRAALRHCMKELSDSSRDLLRRRYARGDSIREIANNCSAKEGAVKMALVRARRTLVRCIENHLTPLESSI